MDDFEVLNRLFTSRIRTKLLKFFCLKPDSSHYIRELERKIEEDAKNISRELQNLEEIGFLGSERRGNLKLFSVRKDFRYKAELESLFQKSSGLKELLKEELFKHEGIKGLMLKEFHQAEEDTGGIKLVIIGHPDRALLNESVNILMKKTGLDIDYRSYTRQEFEERKRMGDDYILEVANGEEILSMGT